MSKINMQEMISMNKFYHLNPKQESVSIKNKREEYTPSLLFIELFFCF